MTEEKKKYYYMSELLGKVLIPKYDHPKETDKGGILACIVQDTGEEIFLSLSKKNIEIQGWLMTKDAPVLVGEYNGFASLQKIEGVSYKKAGASVVVPEKAEPKKYEAVPLQDWSDLLCLAIAQDMMKNKNDIFVNYFNAQGIFNQAVQERILQYLTLSIDETL